MITFEESGGRFFLEMWQYLKGLFYGFTGATTFLTTPIMTLGDKELSIITLCTFAGLSTFIVVALVKWGIS